MSSYNNQKMARPPRKKKAKLDSLTKGLLIAFAVVGIALAFVAGNFVLNFIKGWSLTSLPGAPVDSSGNIAAPGTTPQANLPGDAPAAVDAWDGNSRINILLMGLDYSTEREVTLPGPPKTDTMILVSIDPLSKTVGVLSIRRDLWVNIPGYNYSKINMAYFFGDADKLPGGGPGLAMKTVEQFLGVPIKYYAQVDLNSFVTLIDAIKGVKLDIPEKILLDPMGPREPQWVGPGVVTLDGSYALAYARTRATAGSDFDRGNRQLQVIMAIRDRILEFNMLPNLIANAPTIYNSISNGIQTNLSLSQTIQLASLVLGWPRENITMVSIDPSMVTEDLVDGLQVLRPIPDQIRAVRDRLFVDNGTAAAPLAMGTSDALTLAKSENASIEVLNLTTTGGLADTTGTYLKGQGLNITNTANANENFEYTTIVLHTDKPYTMAYLAKLMQVPTTRIMRKLDTASTTDITVYVGYDWANSNPMN